MLKPFGNTKDATGSQAGASLVEVMIATLLLGVLGTALSILSNLFLKSTKDVDRRVSIEEVARHIATDLDCDATFASKGINFPGGAACPATSDFQPPSSPWLIPMRKNRWGTKPAFTSAQQSDGSFEFGLYRVRVTCSAAEATLIVQAIPKGSKDPADWSLPQYSVYGQVTEDNSGARRKTQPVRKPLCFNDDRNRAPRLLAAGSCPPDYGIVNCTGGGNLSSLTNGCSGSVKCVKYK